MKKRFLAGIIALIMALSLLPALSFADEGNWWEEDIWEEDVLLELGAQLPVYNADLNVYEISTPEQLLYITGYWKNGDSNGDGAPDAPCQGKYVLTADLDMTALNESIGAVLSAKSGKKKEGYIPPIGASTAEDKPGGEKCAFFGEFDGGNHSISNLRVERHKDKYAGLFGNVGHDFGTAQVYNLAILDAYIYAKASAGILAGSVYGPVSGIVVTGTVIVEQKTAGGIAGKIKKNDNGDVGFASNCFAFVDITVLGQGNENGAAGGITSSNSGGGQVYNCFAAGTISCPETKADCVAGISGTLKGGTALDNNISLVSSITTGEGSSNVGLLCGSYAGETGSHIHNNYVWEGSRLVGNPTSDHPETASFEILNTEEVLSKSTYTEKLGWDFEYNWTWIGDDTNGYPMLAPFKDAASNLVDKLQESLVIKEPVFRGSEPAVNSAYEGDHAVITAEIVLPEGTELSSATLFYGTEKEQANMTDSVEMTVSGNEMTVEFPVTEIGNYYYYLAAKAGNGVYFYPSDAAMKMNIVSASKKYAPEQLTISPGETYESVGINWITEQDGLTSELRYREAGKTDWDGTVPAEQYNAVVGDGRGTFTSYSADLTGLKAKTSYEYMAVTNDGTRDYASDIYSFTTLPDKTDVSFIVISDLQATSEEGYQPYLYTTETFLTDTLQPDFVINLGDLTENDTMAEWNYMFNTIGGILGSTLTAYCPGNHETKGDLVYTNFKGRTNLSGGIDDEIIGEATSSFKIGNLFIATLVTEPYSGKTGVDAHAEKMAYYQAQRDWVEKAYKESGCKWLIICAHAGLIQEDDEATAFLEKMCDELGASLYFNGHIHNYYRASVDKDGKKSEPSEAPTFITTSPMGCKFDDYDGEIDDILAFQTGGMDDERQYLTYVHVTDDAIEVTAYQRTEAGDASKKNCADYTAIDSVKIEKKEQKPEPTQKPATVQTTQEPVAQPEPETKTSNPLPYILIGVGVVIAIVAVVLIVKSKKKSE